MVICPKVFLKMKPECTLVQGMCNKMVTRPCGHSITLIKNRKNSINLFSH